MVSVCFLFFFQAEDGIRDLVRSRGLGDVYKRQRVYRTSRTGSSQNDRTAEGLGLGSLVSIPNHVWFPNAIAAHR